MLMDFTSVYLTPKVSNSLVVQDCIIVLEYIIDGQRMRENMDFLCDCPDTNTNDYHFVLHVWLWLFLHKRFIDHFDSIDVWTDGGPHHFKTRYCQWMWWWLSEFRFGQKRISHHFFARLSRALTRRRTCSFHQANHSLGVPAVTVATIRHR